jgi:thioredoxin-dependent peroxiredoxin
MVREGDLVPDFTLRSDTGDTVTLSDLRGRWSYCIYTPRKTRRGARRSVQLPRRVRRVRGARGRRPRREPGHGALARELQGEERAPFTLLADPDHEVAERYGVWVEKNTYGKKAMGIKRSTFVIDEEGKVAKAMLGVKPDNHADLVLSALPG